jgi:hypothetical protein
LENEFMKRGYLLPNGCKDLVETLGPNAPRDSRPPALPVKPAPLPPVTGELLVPDRISVPKLAVAVGKKPFQIVADLMEAGVFATVEQELNFEAISKVVRKYRFRAKRANPPGQN